MAVVKMRGDQMIDMDVIRFAAQNELSLKHAKMWYVTRLCDYCHLSRELSFVSANRFLHSESTMECQNTIP